MHIISLNNQEFKAPSKWEELTATDILDICAVLQAGQSTTVTNHLLAVRLFKVPSKLFYKLREGQKVQLHECLTWLTGKNDLQKWLLKVVMVGKTKLYGPQDRLSTMTAEEFMYAEAAYERWQTEENPAYLDMLFAVLYRKKRWYLNIRKAFDPAKLDEQEKIAGKLKLYVKKAVALNYAGCRNLMIAKHPNIWKKAQEPENQVRLGPKMTNWSGIILDLSGDKFGTYAQTTKTNIWLLLKDLDQKSKKNRSAEGHGA